MGEIRFVGTGDTRGYPYPVCKKSNSCVWPAPQSSQNREREHLAIRGTSQLYSCDFSGNRFPAGQTPLKTRLEGMRLAVSDDAR